MDGNIMPAKVDELLINAIVITVLFATILAFGYKRRCNVYDSRQDGNYLYDGAQ